MKKTILVFIWLFFVIACQAKIITVDDDGPADFSNIQAAIDVSNDGDIIEVQPGTYTGAGNRDIEYNGKAITVRSIDPNDPNIVAATVIDCNGTEEEPHRGFSFRHFEGPNSVLEGLTIRNGYGPTETIGGVEHSVGGGVYCENSSPFIRFCAIRRNTAGYYGGGGIFNNNSDSSLIHCKLSDNHGYNGGGINNYSGSNPRLIFCTFKSNSASVGGAIYNSSNSNPTLTKCVFEENSAGTDGGGMMNEKSGPILANCTFSGNSAGRAGGGIHNHKCNYGTQPTVIQCKFIENSAHIGGGMRNSVSCPTVAVCTFIGNSATGYFGAGGGMQNYISSPLVTDCIFEGNCAEGRSGGKGGGGMHNRRDSKPVLINCSFSNNWAALNGAGVNNDQVSPTLYNCMFTGNKSGKNGGGIHTYIGSPALIGCLFTGNLAGENGGGMHESYFSSATLTNCTFSGNVAIENGGGLYNRQSSPILNNCTVSSNWAGAYGGGMYSEGSDVNLMNCIFWGDAATQVNEIYVGKYIDDRGREYPSTMDVNYSDIGDWDTNIFVGDDCTLDWGSGNIDANPCFVEPGYWDANGTPYDANDDFWVDGDYHLLPDSPCIDAGDPNYVAEPNETDLDGNPRVIAGRIDMGAYETPIQAEARIVPRTINLASKGNWITCYIWLPEQYKVADIEPNSVILENEIQAASHSVDEQDQVAIARFSREDFQSILDIGEVELTITGQLIDGTLFKAKDLIRVINKGGGKPVK